MNHAFLQVKFAPRVQCGATLVELMIAVVLGLLVVLSMTNLLVTSMSVHSAQINATTMQDTARNVFDNIARSVRQAGYVDFNAQNAWFASSEDISPSIVGLDGSTLKATSYGIDSPTKSPDNASDVLAIRFFGSGESGDSNAPLNCAGFGVGLSANSDATDEGRGWSIYYVAKDAYGETNLYCKYNAKNFTAQSIAEGVESFQVLYGIDTSDPANGIANQFVSASQINALDANIPTSEYNKKTHWKKITAIKVALLIRGTEHANSNQPGTVYNLFGAGYDVPSDQGTKIIDPGVAAPKSQSSPSTRKVFSTTIQLKNVMN